MIEVSYSHHLVSLVARAQAAAVALAGVDPDRRSARVTESRRAAALLSARLDGSPLQDDTAARVDAGEVPVLAHIPKAGSHGVGWARALGLDDMEVEEVTAVEYANLRAVDDVAGDLAGAVLAQPLEVLKRLHGVVCQGLVEPEVIGAARQTEQAVHDGAHGMMIYQAMPSAQVPRALAELGEWLQRRSLIVPPVVVAGVAHERLLEIHPFEAGNGRVARAFGRLILMAAGIDSQGVAVLEAPLWADAGGYYGEVAATIRRQGDLTRWLERHTAAVAMALESAVDQLDPSPRPSPPERGQAVVAKLAAGRTMSLRDYAQDVGVDLRTARADLTAFVRAGQLIDVPGGSGLRFQRAPALRPSE